MDTMIERVAKALLAAHDWTVDGQPDELTGWEAVPPDWQDAYRAMARGAIAAMREPTDAMGEAGERAIYDLEPYVAHKAYEAMIDAALAPSI